MTSKRQRLADISMTILRRALEVWDSDKMSFAEARRQAAKQVAQVERMKPPTTTPKSQPAPSDNSDASIKELLFQRILGIGKTTSRAGRAPVNCLQHQAGSVQGARRRTRGARALPGHGGKRACACRGAERRKHGGRLRVSHHCR